MDDEQDPVFDDVPFALPPGADAIPPADPMLVKPDSGVPYNRTLTVLVGDPDDSDRSETLEEQAARILNEVMAAELTNPAGFAPGFKVSLGPNPDAMTLRWLRPDGPDYGGGSFMLVAGLHEVSRNLLTQSERMFDATMISDGSGGGRVTLNDGLTAEEAADRRALYVAGMAHYGLALYLRRFGDIVNMALRMAYMQARVGASAYLSLLTAAETDGGVFRSLDSVNDLADKEGAKAQRYFRKGIKSIFDGLPAGVTAPTKGPGRPSVFAEWSPDQVAEAVYLAMLDERVGLHGGKLNKTQLAAVLSERENLRPAVGRDALRHRFNDKKMKAAGMNFEALEAAALQIRRSETARNRI